MRKRFLITSAAALAVLLLPTVSQAMPMQYGISSGGKMMVRVASRGAPTQIEIRLGSGEITYDAETGILSKASFYAGGHRMSIDRPLFLAPRMTGHAHGPVHLVFASSGRVAVDIQFNTTPMQDIGPAASAVPEPSAALVFGLGIVAAGTTRRRAGRR